MADPVLHVKDAYYFEVPRALAPKNYQSLEEMPEQLEFLKKAHPDATVEEFNEALTGKILIPQPFGKLENLYQAKSGLCISKAMIVEVAVALFIALVYIRLAGMISRGGPPRGRFWNFFEGILVFVRDGIARPAIGGHGADKFVPLLWTMFTFVLFCNLAGMLPFLGTPTGSFGATLALAAITFGTVLIAGMAKFGPVGFWLNQVPHMDLPWYIAPILKPVIFVIEVGGLAIKHGVLGVRLLANMAAGHLVLAAIMGLIVTAAAGSTAIWSTTTAAAVIGSALLSLLELLVAGLQAYIFTFLSALFISAAVHHH